MNVISIRVNDEEMAILKDASQMYSGKVSSMMKKIVFDKLEDDYDIKAVSAYETKKKAGTLETKDIHEVCKDLGIDWDSL